MACYDNEPVWEVRHEDMAKATQTNPSNRMIPA